LQASLQENPQELAGLVAFWQRRPDLIKRAIRALIESAGVAT
jgi:hypothetical protein